MKLNKRLFLFAAAVLFYTAFSFSQNSPESQDSGEQHEEMDLDQLEKEAEGAVSEINPELQKNFIIVEPPRLHELNPQITSYASDSQILTGLYEGLFSYNPLTLEPQYAIAKDYKVSRDKKRMQFIIRDEAKFSNGEKITAQSVKDSWITLLSTPNAPYASLLDIIRGAAEFRRGEVPASEVGIFVNDEKTLSVYLTRPANYLPKVLCHSAFSVIHRNPDVYSGAFVLEDMNEKQIVLKKNPEYWDEKNTHMERITFIQSSGAEETAFLFNDGQIDWVIADLNPEKLLNKSAIRMDAEFGTAYYFFKTSRAKPADEYGVKKTSVWDYPEFRNAVLEAVPWDVLRGNPIVPATTFVYPLPGYPTVQGFDYTDEREAINKMNEARKKYDIPSYQKLKLTFELTQFVLSEEKIEAFKKALEPLGVELVTKEVPVQTYLPGVKTSDSDLFAYTWIGDFADPLAFLELFSSTSTLNDSGWSNSRYDELLEKAASVSETERLKLLAEAETILLDNGLIIPLYHPVSFNILNLAEVGGWAPNSFDIHPLKYLYKKEPVVKKLNNVVKYPND
jgi:oligopeptide transport system substrate-binding protein